MPVVTLGGLLPVMLLVIFGGALGADPIAKYVFQSRPMLVLGRISYSQYLLQYPVSRLVSIYLGHGLEYKIVFPVALVVAAYLTERVLGQTCTTSLRARKAGSGLDEKAIAYVDTCIASSRSRCCAQMAP